MEGGGCSIVGARACAHIHVHIHVHIHICAPRTHVHTHTRAHTWAHTWTWTWTATIRDKIHICRGNAVATELLSAIDADSLPAEYGGTCPGE